MTSVDGMGKGNKAYKRFRSRPAPHNAYTTTSRLRATALESGRAAGARPTSTGGPFVDPSPVAERGQAPDDPGALQHEHHHVLL